MRKIIAVILMLLCVAISYGQTAKKLFKKYKAMPEVMHQEVTDSFSMEMMSGNDSLNSKLTDEERAEILKSIKKVEHLQMVHSDSLLQQLDKDFDALKGYEILMSTSKNRNAEDSAKVFREMFNDVFNPNWSFSVSGKLKGDNVKDVLMRLHVWGKIILVHIDCTIPKDLMNDALSVEGLSFGSDNDADSNMQDAISAYKNGDVLFIIGDEPHPELKTTEQAREYMIKNGINWDGESWFIGEAVKESYPDTDKSVVVKYPYKKKTQDKQ